MKNNIVGSFLAMLIIAGSGLASIPILTRHLTPSDFGHVSLLLMIFSLMAAFDGFRSVIIYCHPKYSENCKGFLYTVNSIMWMVAGAAGFISYGLLYLAFSDQLTNFEISMLSLAAAIYFPMTGKWGVLDAVGQVGLAALIRAVAWLSVYMLFVILAIFEWPLFYYSSVLLCMNIILFAVFSLLDKESARGERLFDRGMAKILVSKARNYLLFQVSAYSMTLIDRVFLAKLQPISMLGFYTPQYELGTRSTTPIRALNSVLYPHFSMQAAKGNGALVRKNWLHVTKWLFVIFSLMAWVIVNQAEFIIALYAGPEYALHSIALKLIITGALINIFGFMAALLLNTFGDFETQGRIYMVGAIVGLVVAYPLISRWGIAGAALTYMVMRFADIALFLSAWRRFIGKPMSGCIALIILLASAFVIQLTVSEFLSAMLLLIFYASLIGRSDIQFLKKLLLRKV